MKYKYEIFAKSYTLNNNHCKIQVIQGGWNRAMCCTHLLSLFGQIVNVLLGRLAMSIYDLSASPSVISLNVSQPLHDRLFGYCPQKALESSVVSWTNLNNSYQIICLTFAIPIRTSSCRECFNLNCKPCTIACLLLSLTQITKGKPNLRVYLSFKSVMSSRSSEDNVRRPALLLGSLMSLKLLLAMASLEGRSG